MRQIWFACLLMLIPLLSFVPKSKLVYKITVEANVGAMIRQEANNPDNGQLLKVLLETRRTLSQAKSQHFIKHFQQVFKQQMPDQKLATFFVKPSGQQVITTQSSDKSVVKFLEKQLQNALQQTKEVLAKRIRKFRVRGAKLMILKQSPQILIKLPKVKHLERLKKIILQAGKLGFWEVHELQECLEGFRKIQKEMPTGTRFSIVTEKLIVRSSDTMIVNNLLRRAKVRDLFPRNALFLWTATTGSFRYDKGRFSLFVIRNEQNGVAPFSIKKVRSVKKVRTSYSEPEIAISMDKQSALKWAQLTKKNAKKRIALVLDGKVCCAPMIDGEIKNGNMAIMANFTIQQANDLMCVLVVGKLPVPLTIVSEANLGG